MTTGMALLEPNEQGKGGKELSTAGAVAAAQTEIQSAIAIARRFPRNEDQAFQKLMKAATRPSFAEDANYNFPRGKNPDGSQNYVTGPSVNLAREAARVWGNIRYGLYIVRDDEETRLIRGWAWDVETNTKVELEDDFVKVHQRKDKQGNTQWVTPDERDLRELTNRRGAILVRNCILQVLPKDLVEDALGKCFDTLETDAKKDPDAIRKRLLFDFGELNVTVEMLEKKLGHAFAQCSPKELADLRAVCKSISDGHTTWAEYAKDPDEKAAVDPNKEALAAGQEALKREREQPKPEPEKQPAPPAGQPVRDMAWARKTLREASSAKEIAEVGNWADNAEISSTERVEIMQGKREAADRIGKQNSKRGR